MYGGKGLGIVSLAVCDAPKVPQGGQRIVTSLRHCQSSSGSVSAPFCQGSGRVYCKRPEPSNPAEGRCSLVVEEWRHSLAASSPSPVSTRLIPAPVLAKRWMRVPTTVPGSDGRRRSLRLGVPFVSG